MSMQFEYPVTVLSATRVVVEGRTFAAVFVGEPVASENSGNCHGFSIRKVPADPAVFDQLNDIRFGQPQHKTLLMILKQASGGKAQPHVVGVVPNKSAPAQAKA